MKENWEIGRDEGSGIILSELGIDKLMDLLREIVINNNWEAEIEAKLLVEKYDDFKRKIAKNA